MPIISVLMGIYNENKIYASQAIDSILNQTFSDFEFIICDDGSNPAFYRWLYGYCRKDKRIRLLRSSCNQGLAAALNNGLKCAEGKYVARMDADDISARERLARQYDFLEAHPEYALTGCSVRMTGKRGIWGMRIMEEIPTKESFLKTSPFVHPAIMIRMDAVKALHGYSESKTAVRAEDYEFFMRLYVAGFRGYNLQEPLLSYREDESSLKKRKYRYRIHECMVRYRGFCRLGILKGNYRYVAKPLIAGLVPAGWMMRIRKHRYAQTGKSRCKPERTGRKP